LQSTVSMTKPAVCIATIFMIWMAAVPAPAQKIARENIEGPVIQSHAGLGVMPFYPVYFPQPYIGIQGYVTFRPAYAKYFYPEFEALNIGMGLNLSYLMLEKNLGFYKADLVFRKYFSRFEERPGEDSAFFGVGIGITGLIWKSSYVVQRDVTWIAEMGYEYRVLSDLLATVKVQMNRIRVEPINFTGLSFVLALGWQFDS
jgi:hypothetical protein